MNQKNSKHEPRKGFHPALVISTIAVVIFVLWFCPHALMNARIEQTEERAVAIMKNREFSRIDNSFTVSPDYDKITPVKTYTDYFFFRKKSNPDVFYAVPQYYGRTAFNTFCYADNTIYKKDIRDVNINDFDFPLPDSTWTE